MPERRGRAFSDVLLAFRQQVSTIYPRPAETVWRSARTPSNHTHASGSNLPSTTQTPLETRSTGCLPVASTPGSVSVLILRGLTRARAAPMSLLCLAQSRNMFNEKNRYTTCTYSIVDKRSQVPREILIVVTKLPKESPAGPEADAVIFFVLSGFASAECASSKAGKPTI